MTTPLPVVIISQTPPPLHGSTVMTATLIDTLCRVGYAPDLIDRRFSSSVSDIGKVRPSKLVAGIGLMARVARRARRRDGAPFIFFMTNRPASFLVDWAISEILRLSKRPVIGYLHTVGFVDLARRGRLWAWLVRRLLTSATRIVCLSERLRTDTQPWVRDSALHVIANTAGHPPGIGALTPRTGKQLLYLSNLIPEKGAADALRVAAALRDIPGLRVVVAGAKGSEGFLSQLLKEVEDEGLSEIVMFSLAPSGERKWELLSSASLLMFPSRYPYEAQPLTILESFAIGTPVIAYDVGAVSDEIEDGVSGFVVPAGDVAALAGRARQIMGNPDLLQALSTGARREYEARFSPATYDRAWSRVLRDFTDTLGARDGG